MHTTPDTATGTSFVAPDWADRFPRRLSAGQSTRHGGYSRGDYAGLNLGLYTDDNEKHVTANRRHLAGLTGFPHHRWAGSLQVHDNRILTVRGPGQWMGYDALITDRPGILLTVTVADCVPVLLYDPQHSAIGAVHAGWKGTVAEIVRLTVERMQEEFGTDPAAVYAWIGACIAECDFEVDADVADHFSSPCKRWDEQRGKYFVDLKAANRSQLLAAGLPEGQIGVSARSTVSSSKDFFSHRAEGGRTGRGLGFIGLKEA